MKYLLLITSFIFMVSCNNSEPNNEITKLLAYGKITELNALNPEIEKDLMLRLYQIPKEGENCFKETHGICKYQYFISVSTFDEYPDTNFYKLSSAGEIIQINWVKDAVNDSAELIFNYNSYTSPALSNNKELKNNPFSVNITVNPKTIIEKVNVSR